MAGAVLILVVLVLVGPIAVMLGGALWSACMGWSHVETANARAAAQDSQD